MQHERAVLPDAVVAHERADVRLVHVDVVHAVSRQKAEDLVRVALLGRPALAEREERGALVGDRAADVVGELLVEVVVGAGHVEGQRPQLRAIEEVRADEVQRDAARPPLERRPASRQRRDVDQHRVVEVRVDDVLELRWRELRRDVDRDAEVRPAAIHDVQLEVGVGCGSRLMVDDAAAQHAVGLQGHGLRRYAGDARRSMPSVTVSRTRRSAWTLRSSSGGV